MKVALLEASHWHVPLYLDPLEASGIEVVAVSDAEQAKGQAIAARFGSTLYSSSNDLLDREEVDFAFVFGRHSEMPALAEAVIGRRPGVAARVAERHFRLTETVMRQLVSKISAMAGEP